MARKDHLITIQEEDKSSKQSIKRNNAILFQAIQPTIANEINGIGATSKTPDEVKDTKFPILNPINAIGKNTNGTVNVDLSLENSPFVCIELSDVGATIGAIVINLLSLVKNFAEKFILDITKDPGNVSLPTVTFSPTVENLPAGFPDNDPRYLLEIVARETPTETRFEVVNRSGGSGTIPAGTIENQHLEWDNVATDWVAVQASTYGATGPFATTGFLRFANDNIMTSQRNAADTGNLETKVSTLDEFDFTNSLNGLVDLSIRAQDAVNPDAKFVIRQNPDDGASGDITTFTAPQSILLNVNASILMTIGPTEVDVQANLDMNLGNIREITEIHGRDDATPFKIIFDIAEDGDTFISDDTAIADRINVTAGGVTFWSWLNDGTDKFAGIATGSDGILTISDGQMNVSARTVPPDADVSPDELTIYGDTATDPLRLRFKRKTVAAVVDTASYVYSPMDFILDMGNNEINNTAGIFPQDNGLDDIGALSTSYNSIYMDALHFVHSQVTVAGERMISFIGGGELVYNVPTADFHSFKIQDAETMRIEGVEVELNLNKVLRFNATTDVTLSVTVSNPFVVFSPNGTVFTSQTSGTGQIITITGDLGGDELVPAQIILKGDDSLGNKTEYAIIKSRIKDPTNPTERGNLEFEVNFGGGMTKMLEVSGDASTFGVRVFDRLKMEGTNQLVINDSFLEFTDSRTNPGQSGVVRRLFTDSGNSSHLSVVTDTGVVDLEAGGGEVFTWTADHDAANFDLLNLDNITSGANNVHNYDMQRTAVLANDTVIGNLRFRSFDTGSVVVDYASIVGTMENRF